MQVITIEDFRDFEKRHGGESIEYGNRFLFPTGAACDLNFGARWEPPMERWALLKAKRGYIAAKLKIEEDAFYKFKADQSERAAWAKENRNMAGPQYDGVEQLTRGRDKVLRLREQLAAFDEALSNSPEAVGKRQGEQAERERIESINARLDEINSIEI